jgi:hypothetical protein
LLSKVAIRVKTLPSALDPPIVSCKAEIASALDAMLVALVSILVALAEIATLFSLIALE